MSENKLVKKYIGSDQVGSNQIELENNASLNAKSADGLSSEALMKLDPSNLLQMLKQPNLPGNATSDLEAVPKQQLDEAVGGIESDISALEGRVDTLESEMDTAQADIISLDGRVDSLESQVSTLESEMDTAQADIISLDGRVDTLESQVSTLESEMDTAQADIISLDGRVDTLESEMDAVEGDISDLQAEDLLFLKLDGSRAMTGALSMGSQKITNLAEPTQATDAASKQYVDAVAEGLHIHAPVKVIINQSLESLTSGTVTYDNGVDGVGATLVLQNALASYDDYTFQEGDRVIINGQTNKAHNGIYIVGTNGSLGSVFTRASDYNTPVEMAGGDFVFVQDGDQFADTGWVQIDTVLVVGTDPVQFVQFSGAGSYAAGSGLSLNGNVFDVNVDNTTISINGSNQLQVASGVISRIDTLESEMDTAQADIISLDGRVDTLESEMDTAQADIISLDGRVDTLESEMDTAQADIIALDGRVDSLEINVDVLIADVSAVESDISSLESRVDTLESEMDTAQADIIALDGRVDTLESEMDTAQADIISLDGRVDTLESEMDTAQADIISLDGRVDSLESQVSTLESEMDTAQADIISLDGRVDTLESEMDTAQADIISLDGRVDTLESEMDTAQADIIALDGRVDTLESEMDTVQAEVQLLEERSEIIPFSAYNSFASIYADGQPGQLDPTSTTNPRHGWYYKNTVAGQKINWYFFDGLNQANITLGNFSAYAVMTFDAVRSPILAVYTVPTGSGDIMPGFAHSKVAYSGFDGASPSVGQKCVVYFGQEPIAHPELPKFKLLYVAAQSGGDQAPSEQVLTSSFGSDSGAAVNAIQYMVESLGVESPAFRGELDLEIRPVFRQLDGSVDMLNAKISNLADPTLPQDAASKAYVDAQIASGTDFEVQKIVLSAGDIANQYIDLAFKASLGSIIASSQRVNLVAVLGADVDADFQQDNSGAVTRLSFQGPSASAGESPLEEGQIIYFNYVKA